MVKAVDEGYTVLETLGYKIVEDKKIS